MPRVECHLNKYAVSRALNCQIGIGDKAFGWNLSDDLKAIVPTNVKRGAHRFEDFAEGIAIGDGETSLQIWRYCPYMFREPKSGRTLHVWEWATYSPLGERSLEGVANCHGMAGL
jgi:hypothetical protein